MKLKTVFVLIQKGNLISLTLYSKFSPYFIITSVDQFHSDRGCLTCKLKTWYIRNLCLNITTFQVKVHSNLWYVYLYSLLKWHTNCPMSRKECFRYLCSFKAHTETHFLEINIKSSSVPALAFNIPKSEKGLRQ